MAPQQEPTIDMQFRCEMPLLLRGKYNDCLAVGRSLWGAPPVAIISAQGALDLV